MWIRSALIALLFSIGGEARAQPAAEQNSSREDVRAARERELREAAQALQSNEARLLELQREISALRGDRARLNGELIESARKVRDLEVRVAAASKKAGTLAITEHALRRSLDGRRATVIEVLAALQRIGRAPPPAVLVRPQDALDAVRSSILLGAVLPELRQEAALIAADLTSLIEVQRDLAAERAVLESERAALADSRQRVEALMALRQQDLQSAEKSLAETRMQAGQLSRQAESLKELIARMESENQAAKRAADAAAQAPRIAQSQAQIAALAENAFRDPARLSPKIAFQDARGVLPQPVSGSISKAYGAPDGIGGIERGVTLAAGADAIVTAPADGWVAFAGPFRSYRNVLIINVGGGYHVLLIGADRVTVDVGQFVLTGEPVAVMGAAQVSDGAERQSLYIEFRKDGIPVDPGPWWAKADSDKPKTDFDRPKTDFDRLKTDLEKAKG